MSALASLTMRELKKWYRRRIAIIFTFITPLFWLALFGKSMNLYSLLKIPSNVPPQFVQFVQQAIDQIIIAAFGTKDYFTFLATGMFSVFILFSSMFSGMSLIFDRRLGYLSRLLVAPIKRETIFLSRVISSIIRSLLQFTALLIIAIALGLQLGDGFNIIHLASLYATLALLALAFSTLFIALSLKIEEHDTAIAITNLLNLPLMFASNSIFPKNQMPQWLQIIADINPLTHSNIIIRKLVIEASLDIPIKSLAYLLGIAILTTILGLYLSRKLLKHL